MDKIKNAKKSHATVTLSIFLRQEYADSSKLYHPHTTFSFGTFKPIILFFVNTDSIRFKTGYLLLCFPTCRSCLAASAPALELKVTKPTGEAVFPFLLVTFSSEPSYPCTNQSINHGKRVLIDFL